jgi:hypothetical protein
MSPEAARYDLLLKLPKGENLGAALNEAMEAAETAFPPLHIRGNYQRNTSASKAMSSKKCFENSILTR